MNTINFKLQIAEMDDHPFMINNNNYTDFYEIKVTYIIRGYIKYISYQCQTSILFQSIFLLFKLLDAL